MFVDQRVNNIIVLACLLLSSSPILRAQDSSAAYPPISWVNRPIQFSHKDLIAISPFLLSGSDGPGFICGFYCKTSGIECLFGVVITQNRSDSVEFLQHAELVWSANRNNPVQSDAQLQLRQDGDLVLANSDGTLVWSSNTRGKPVSGLKLTEVGNLVLFGKNNEPIWQSFDHPTDTLLLGQKLCPGQHLRASVSESNLSQGMLFLSAGSDDLSAYIESNPPQSYYHMSSGMDSNACFEFRNGSFNGLNIPTTPAAQFLKFRPDGHLKVYQWAGTVFTEVIDLSNKYFQAGDCGYPTVCGKYGVCSEGQCGCIETPESQKSFFRQTVFQQPNLGCSLVTPISCDHSQYHSLLELKNTYYFAFNSSKLRSQIGNSGIRMEDCKSMCLSNCSCKAALFGIYGDSEFEGECVLLNEVFSIINNENYRGSFDNTTMFVKVQNPHVKTSSSKKVILASVVGAFLGLLSVIGSCLVLLRRRLKKSKEIEGEFLDQVPGMPIRYSYENLKSVAENFSKKLGKGGFGSVYEGTLIDGRKLAVKCLDGLGQVTDSFLAEVKTIGSIHHVNLVKLIGFCFEKSHRILVYQYMANGSLDKWIFGENRSYSLPWRTRTKIISGIAKGLAYLHEDCSQKIIHFDVKPQNILLDENFNAKVSDFGLSKLIEKDESKVVTRMRGTPGYLAPEWLSSIVTEKVDVYSFGIVMLEILCGRKNFDWSKIEEDRHLLSIFKRKAEEERLQDMVDRKSDDMQIHVEEAVEMMRIAAWCLQSDFTKRPSMSLVVKVLEGLAAAETNLDYDFTNSSIVRTKAADDQGQAAVCIHSSLPPSVLSGPR